LSAPALFWGAAATVAYTYVGFPLLLLARAQLRPRPWRALSGAEPPTVTVVIAAHNEETAIGDKVRNVLSLEYPPDRLDCVVVSDGSTDATVSVASEAGGDRVQVIDLPRSGKATALNRGVSAATGSVLVFTDANSRLAEDSISKLVAPLADPAVGGVAGDQRYIAGDEAAGERTYWDLDRLMKQAESRSGNVVSATGALYAVRATLARPIPDGVTDDFAMSTGVIEQGDRLVFEPEAVALEPPAEDLGGEYQRKVRVMTRGLRAVMLRRRLLDPRRSGFYAVQLFSHKVLRRLAIVPMVLAAVSAWRLRRRNAFYGLAAGAQIAGHGASLVGLLLARTRLGRNRAVAVPAYFGMVNAAALHAVWNIVSGKRIDRWTPQRTDEEPK
jgi:cellulose synthase/poly-beta-1,6-N-acetylglucosamine synthase-like glycosyltransferase